MRSNNVSKELEHEQQKVNSSTVKTRLTIFAKTKRKSAVWLPCLAATFSSATSATCKYLCVTELEVLLLTSYLLAGPTNFEVTSKTNTYRAELHLYTSLLLQMRVQQSFFLYTYYIDTLGALILDITGMERITFVLLCFV